MLITLNTLDIPGDGNGIVNEPPETLDKENSPRPWTNCLKISPA